jgi:hypothetical protein
MRLIRCHHEILITVILLCEGFLHTIKSYTGPDTCGQEFSLAHVGHNIPFLRRTQSLTNLNDFSSDSKPLHTRMAPRRYK